MPGLRRRLMGSTLSYETVIPGRALRANPESITTDVAFSARVAGTVVMDSGSAPSKSADDELDNDIAELG